MAGEEQENYLTLFYLHLYSCSLTLSLLLKLFCQDFRILLFAACGVEIMVTTALLHSETPLFQVTCMVEQKIFCPCFEQNAGIADQTAQVPSSD